MPTPTERDASVTPDTVTDTSFPGRRPPLRRGAVVGRYVVIDRAGEGGMGVVYKAYDPELERPVALKLLHAGPRDGEDSERRSARLLREAKALARLQHPHVVAVHDVGTFDGDVFLATEYVEGAPLKSWVLTDKPPTGEILRVMIAAGEGLAAAHRAGLIHRDVKPGNLHVGKDGRVRVLDFGLARADVSEEPTHDDILDGSPGSGHGSLDAPLTRAGHVVGTPRYMAPEQHTGEAVDARSDQFSYCATLYECLYGEAPFDAGDDEYRTSVTSGKLRGAPEGSHVPRRLRQILVRGMSPRPEDRWPSMDALLDELRRDPAATRRRVLGAAAVVLVAGAAVAAATFGTAKKAAPVCVGAEEKLAGVWDDAAKRAVSSAFAASGASGATEAYARVENALNDYASQWTAMRTDACLATRVRAEQSEEMLDLRMECLDERLGELGAQVQVLAHADAGTVDKAPQAAGSLPSLAGCADAAALRAPIRPPTDAAARARVEAVRGRLADGHARQRVADYGGALGIATTAAADAASLGYPPLEAEALYLLGDVEDDQGDYKASEKTMLRAATAAIAGHHDEMLARSLAALVVEVGLRQARFEEAHAWAPLAEAAAERGDAFVRGEVRRNVGRLLYREGKFAEARAQTEACLAVWRPVLGDDAFSMAGPLTDLGNVYDAEADYAHAAEMYERSIAVLEKIVGPDSPQLGANLNNLADVEMHVGQFDRAVAAGERAVKVWTAGLGPEHPKVGLALFTLGDVWRLRGEPGKALPYYRRALAIDEKALGQGSPETAYPVEGTADALRAMGDPKAALPFYLRALAMREKALGPTHVEVADTLTGLGEVRLATGDAKQATALLERAMTIRTSQPGDPADLEETKRALERARAKK
ncbi:MAG TPA: serine/threonine-protein kinase [Polyangiaceae bacterium]